jgi:hypothetical protein
VYVLFPQFSFLRTRKYGFLDVIVGIVVAHIGRVSPQKSIFKTKELSRLLMELPPYRMPTFMSIWFQYLVTNSFPFSKAVDGDSRAEHFDRVILAIPVGGNGHLLGTLWHITVCSVTFLSNRTCLYSLGFGEWETAAL